MNLKDYLLIQEDQATLKGTNFWYYLNGENDFVLVNKLKLNNAQEYVFDRSLCRQLHLPGSLTIKNSFDKTVYTELVKTNENGDIDRVWIKRIFVGKIFKAKIMVSIINNMETTTITYMSTKYGSLTLKDLNVLKNNLKNKV